MSSTMASISARMMGSDLMVDAAGIISLFQSMPDEWVPPKETDDVVVAHCPAPMYRMYPF